MVVGLPRLVRRTQECAADIARLERIVNAPRRNVLQFALLLRGDTRIFGPEEIVPHRSQVGVSLQIVDLENTFGTGLLRRQVPDCRVGNRRKFGELAQVPGGGQLLDRLSEQCRFRTGEVLVAGLLQQGLSPKGPCSGFADLAACRSGLHVGQGAFGHVLQVVENGLVDFGLGPTVVVGPHLLRAFEFFQYQWHVAPLGHQPVIGQRAQEPRLGLIRVAGRRRGVAHIAQVGKERVGPRNDFVKLRIAVVDVDVLRGERIIVELVGDAAVGAAAGHDGRIGAHIGKIVIVIGNITLRQQRIDAVERRDDVILGGVVVAGRYRIRVIFVEKTA